MTIAATPIDPATLEDLLYAPRREALLRDYFGTRKRSGHRFERLGGGGDRPEVADRFTAEDIVAVSLLAVAIPGRAAIEVLETKSWSLNHQLARLPADAEFIHRRDLLEGGGPADTLWRALTSIDGIGWVTAGKLLATKRPHLVPVYDELVQTRLGRTGTATFWLPLHEALSANEQRLWNRLRELRSSSGIGEDISLLRVLDVIAWVDETDRRHARAHSAAT